MNTPILSIVIPIKGRYTCLFDIITYILSWNSNDFELLVHDNNEDNSDFIAFYEKIKQDSRLRYFHEPRFLSIIENSEKAIEKSKGKYVCYIGDDDGIIRQIIDVAYWMDKNKVDSFNCAHGAYLWGGFRMNSRGKKRSLAGVLTYKDPRKIFIQQLDPVDEVNVILESGANTMARITRVYQGILSRKLLEKVKTKTGSYFPGPVPDMTNAVATAFLATKHVYMNYPIIIAGGSKSLSKSNKGQKIGHDEIKNVPFLPKDSFELWSKDIPPYWSPPTIWAEGLFKALEKSGQDSYKKNFNFPMLFAHFLMWAPDKEVFLKDFIKKRFDKDSKSILVKTQNLLKTERAKSIFYEIKVLSILLSLQGWVGLKILENDQISGVLSKLEEDTDILVENLGHNHFKDLLMLK